MGKFYHYRCNRCGFEQEYRVGVGFFSHEEMKMTFRLQTQLEEDLRAGKYGEVFQALAQTDELRYDCNTALYQCRSCRKLAVRRGKRMEYSYFTKETKAIRLSVEFDKCCTACNSDHMKKST